LEISLEELKELLELLETREEEGDGEEGPQNFYYNPHLLRKMVMPNLEVLRGLNIPNLRRWEL